MLYSTQDAIKKGLRPTLLDQLIWTGLRSRFIELTFKMMEKGRFDTALYFTTQAQFCREALNAQEIIDTHPALFKDVLNLETAF